MTSKPKPALLFAEERFSLLLDGKWVGSMERVPSTQEWNYFISGSALGKEESGSVLGRVPSLKLAQQIATAAISDSIGSSVKLSKVQKK